MHENIQTLCKHTIIHICLVEQGFIHTKAIYTRVQQEI